MVYKFGEQKDFDNWVTTSDSDHNEGNSHAKFEMSPAGYGLFHGNVVTSLPVDGKIKRAGYCNIKSQRVRKSFKRETTYDWRQYTTLGKSTL